MLVLLTQSTQPKETNIGNAIARIEIMPWMLAMRMKFFLRSVANAILAPARHDAAGTRRAV